MQIVAYYFPNYHQDKRNNLVHGKGWTEWELLKKQIDKGAINSKVDLPLWGYEDEADPEIMAKKINTAADNGLTGFIFDWYYYEDGLFLERALEEGFLRAENQERLNFALMWANHDWLDMHPAESFSGNPLLYSGEISSSTFDRMTDYIIEKYFLQKNYWLIDGCPYFSIYEISKFIKSMGGMKGARFAIEKFRNKVKNTGFPDLHLNGIYFQIPVLENEHQVQKMESVIETLQFDSLNTYTWCHHLQLKKNYTAAIDLFNDYLTVWEDAVAQFSVPYFPNVSVAWNNNPRYVKDFTRIMTNTPQDFEEILCSTKEKLQNYPDQPQIISINAWNEWTEGSYLEPDVKNGFDYLKKINSVFGKTCGQSPMLEV